MQRLARKFETAKSLVPKPVTRPAGQPASMGAIFFGSTSAAMEEAIAALEARGIYLDHMLRWRSGNSTTLIRIVNTMIDQP